MRRIGRWMLDGLTALSLVVCVGTAVLWARNRNDMEEFALDWVTSTGTLRFETHYNSITSWGSNLYFLHEYERQDYYEIENSNFREGPEGWKELRRNFPDGWHFLYRGSNTAAEIDLLHAWHGFGWQGNGPRKIFAGRQAMAGAPAWFLLGLFGAMPLTRMLTFARRRRAYRMVRGRCAQCSYDLTGNVSGVCPECGMKIAEAK